MTKVKLLDIIKNSLMIDHVSIDDSIETLDEWDSLAQLEILANIDIETNGQASKIWELAVALSVKQLIEVLEKNNLINE